ncbi:MAG TPA: M48 family metallopeptidase [Candidatus Omnitrophota bacterium]|nr:M48 family metallopeptidase [Candidatus Omnitrophota bacterium]
MSRSKAYHRTKLALFAVDLGASLVFVLLFYFSGFSRALSAQAVSLSEWIAIQAFFYSAVFFTAYTAALLPVHFLSSFSLEHAFGLSNQTLWAWILDEVKRFAISILFFSLLGAAFYELVSRFPNTWWIFTGVGWLVMTVILTKILPTLLIPIFYKMKPLEDGELRSRLLALAEKCGVPVMGIYVIGLSLKTKKGNAALVGMGRSRRVVLGDTLLDRYTPEEIETVLAHELGHHKLKHIPSSIAFSGAVVFAGFFLLHLISGALVNSFGASSLSDLSIYPILFLLSLVAGLFILPAQNTVSRSHENEADRFALDTTRSLGSFKSLMQKLGAQNLADPEPHPAVEFMLYDHPAISTRIRLAERYLRT